MVGRTRTVSARRHPQLAFSRFTGSQDYWLQGYCRGGGTGAGSGGEEVAGLTAAVLLCPPARRLERRRVGLRRQGAVWLLQYTHVLGLDIRADRAAALSAALLR